MGKRKRDRPESIRRQSKYAAILADHDRETEAVRLAAMKAEAK